MAGSGTTAGEQSMGRVLDLEQLADTVFRGRSGEGVSGRIFGGEVVAQALVAVGRTVTADRPVHSLHGYFLRPGDPELPLLFRVERLRDGRSFANRQVVVLQADEVIFTLAASFHVPETGLVHQVAVPDAPAAEGLPTAAEALEGHPPERRDFFARLLGRFPLTVRFPEEPPGMPEPTTSAQPRHRLWVRAIDVPDDPLLHAAAATYASDLFLLAAALPPHTTALAGRDVQVASLDHAMWFHAPFRADAWLLYEQEGTRAASGRVLARGAFFDAAGTHVASVIQEGLVRLRT